MKKHEDSIFSSDKALIFYVIGFYIALTFFVENWLLNEKLFYEFYSSMLPLYSIEAILDSRERFWWVAYVVQLFLLIIKFTFTALCIFVGVLLTEIEIPFKDLFMSVVVAESIFIFAQFINMINLYTYQAELTFETIANYFPLTMLSFWGTENVVPWLHYPMQTLNLFEIAYILFISWLLSRQWKPSFLESINIVLPSYGIGLLIWMVLVVFLTLQIS